MIGRGSTLKWVQILCNWFTPHFRLFAKCASYAIVESPWYLDTEIKRIAPFLVRETLLCCLFSVCRDIESIIFLNLLSNQQPLFSFLFLAALCLIPRFHLEILHSMPANRSVCLLLSPQNLIFGLLAKRCTVVSKVFQGWNGRKIKITTCVPLPFRWSGVSSLILCPLQDTNQLKCYNRTSLVRSRHTL